MYLAPRSGPAVRYDTRAGFRNSASWEHFDTTKLKGATNNFFAGSAFDGRYVYYVPNYDITGAPQG